MEYFSSDYLEKQYDQMARQYNDSRNEFDNSRQLAYLDGLLKEGDTVLDAGCGSGIPVARYFTEEGYRVVGFDLSKEMIRLAKENVPNADFFKADLLTVDLPDETYDMVVSFYCVFHIKKNDQAEVFRKFYATLKPGGYSYFTLAGKGYTGHETFQGTKRFGEHVLPYAHFSEKEYRRILGETGFRVHSMEDLTIGGETMLWVLVSR